MSVRFGDLKKDLLGLVGCLEKEGTASGGSANTLVDAGVLTEEDDTWITYYVYIHNGTAQGDERTITDSSSSGASITVSPNFSATPTTDSEYYLYHTYRNSTIERAIKVALRLMRRHTLLPMVDETIVLGDPALAATYEITVPTGFAAIRQIWKENDQIAGLYDEHIPGPGDTDYPWWRVIRSATRKIRLDKAIASCGWITQGKKLRVIGQQYQAEPSSDDSTLDLNTGPLLVLAQAILRLQAMKQPDEIEPTRRAMEDALRAIGLGRGFEQGTVIVEEA